MDILEVLDILEHEFTERKGELEYNNVFQLLVAVTLSAQTTDAAVNKVTPALFEAYPTIQDLANANVRDVEALINKIGLYRNKAKFIVNCAQMILDDYGGEVPNTREALMTLPGVGRKTANVVMSEGFGLPAIAVDTHIERVAKRLGIADKDDNVLTVENKLMHVIPEDLWARSHLLLLLFGRYYSTARDTQDIYLRLEELKEKHNL